MNFAERKSETTEPDSATSDDKLATGADNSTADSGKSIPDAGKAVDNKDPAATAADAAPSSLQRVWMLHDQLQGRTLGRGYSPIDFAPQIWIRINDQIIFLEQQQRRGRELPLQELARLESDLDLLAKLMSANEAGGGARYQGNLLEVSARLVAAWNQFAAGTGGAGSMNGEQASFRDIYFRSRYMMQWLHLPSYPETSELQDEILALIAGLQREKPRFLKTTIRSDEVTSLAASIQQLRDQEQKIFLQIATRVSDWNKFVKDRRPIDVYRGEQLYSALLDSPLTGYGQPFGFVDSGSGIDVPGILNRRILDQQFASLLASDLRPADAPSFTWASDPWVAPAQKNVREMQDRIGSIRSFLMLINDQARFSSPLALQLPDRSKSSRQEWEKSLDQCLDALRGAAAEISAVEAASVRSMAETSQNELQTWSLAIALDQQVIHTGIDQTLDSRFVALPPQVEAVAEPIVVEFDTTPGKMNTAIVNLDLPQATRQFYFTTRGQAPPGIELVLSVDDPDREFQDLLEIRDGANTVIIPETPFTFPLVRDTNGQLQPLSLTFHSARTGAQQSGRQVGLSLRLAGTDDPVVRVNDREFLRLTVQLPKEDRVDLVIGKTAFGSGSISASSSPGSGAFYDPEMPLYAFPNRFRVLDFQIENKSGRKKRLTLQLFSVRPSAVRGEELEVPGQVLPAGTTDGASLQRNLERLAQATLADEPVATSKPIELEPGADQFFDFRPEPPLPAGNPDAAAASNGGAVATAAETLIDLDHGLLCRLNEIDVDHGEQRTRDFWLDLKPLPSEELVAATARFDPVDGLFSVEVLPRWDASLPCPVAGGVECILETGNSGPFADNLVRRLAMLDDENRRGELQFRIDREQLGKTGPLLLYVNVNGYRAVFIYKLGESDFQGPPRIKPNLRPDNNFLVLRKIITQTGDKPPVDHFRNNDNWAFLPPDQIDFELLADMDDGVSSECRIQFDIKREEWTTPKTQSRQGDRQIDYRARINPANGFLDVKAIVMDHRFDWRPNEKVSGRCELKGSVDLPAGRVLRGATDAVFVETLLMDGLPPQCIDSSLVVAGIRQDRYARIKENQQQVAAEFLSEDLTGTRSVRLYVDKDNDPVIGDKDLEIGTAEPLERKESWRYRFDLENQLKSKMLDYGENRIYAVLTDQLGNETDRQRPIGPLTLTVDKLTDLEKAMIEEAKIRKYTLIVRSFRLSALENRVALPEVRPKVIGSDNTEIQFRSEANEDGSYSILDVPVGEYTVVSEYTYKTSTHRVEKLRAELIVRLTAEKAPEPIVLVLVPVKDE
jgi:hypothetical protein